MNPMNVYFDVRDIFRAPRLGLSGKKIWVFVVGNLVGFAVYWILTYLSLILAGVAFSDAWAEYGLYPCLFGNPAPWYAFAVYAIGAAFWFFAINLACTAVSRITYKQLKGDEFYSSGDAWSFVRKHWHPVIFTSITIVLIVLFFIFFAAIFALFGKIKYLGDFLFALPYLFYFFGSIFTVYTIIVFITSFIYTPAIVAAYEEDTMGAVFQSYSITWSQPWRIILYNSILIPLAYLAIKIFGYFWIGGYKLVNLVFGNEWLMGSKLYRVVGWATDVVIPKCICPLENHDFWGFFMHTSSNATFPTAEGMSLSGTESVAAFIVAIFLFLLFLSVISYGLSVLSVGETLMFVIFKKRSDDDNLLERKDEEELEEEEDLEEEDQDDESTDASSIETDDSSAESEDESEEPTPSENDK